MVPSWMLVCADELAVIPEGIELPSAKYAEDESSFTDVITAATYLPRVALCGGNSGPAKEGKIQMGHYGLIKSKDVVIDLGVEFPCLPLSWRFRAMRIPGDGNVLSYYNPTSPEFKKVQVDSEVKDSGAFFGVEFLLWVPDQRCFATFFFNSKTARRQAPAMKALWKEKRAATFKVEFIKKAKFSWHGQVVVPCSTPFPIPDAKDMLEEAERFANPAESVIEKAEEAAASGREV